MENIEDENKAQEPVEVTLPEGLTQSQVDAWKKKYGEVHLLNVRPKGTDENHFCVVRPPDRPVMKRVSAESNPVKSLEIMLDECFLWGDESIKKDERFFYIAAAKVSALVEKGEAELAKL